MILFVVLSIISGKAEAGQEGGTTLEDRKVIREQHAVARASEDSRVPPVALINKIERALKVHHCVGAITQYNRRYAYDLGNDTITTARVVVSLRKLDKGSRGARSILRWREYPTLEHRLAYTVEGYYSVPTSRLIVTKCGNQVR